MENIVLYTKDKTKLLCAIRLSRIANILSSIAEIVDKVFFECETLASISIGYNAFDDCKSLISISVPHNFIGKGKRIGFKVMPY